MTDHFRRWDSAEYLKTEDDMAEYLLTCREVDGNDPAFIAKALRTIARARERHGFCRSEPAREEAGISDINVA